MARPSTLPGPWLDLANALGGIEALCTCLSWSYMSLYRRSRGLVRIPKADRMLVEQTAKMHRVPSPLLVENLTPLELLGEALAMNYPVDPTEINRLRSKFTESELIKLAESDAVSPLVLMAVTRILES